MKPPPFARAAPPAALDPGGGFDPTPAVNLDLANTDLRETAGTLSRLLRGIATWADGHGPVRVQHRGRLACEAIRDAIACLRYLLRNPTSAMLRGEIALECRLAVHPLEQHGATWTAAEFAQAACRLEPREPWHALEVARLARTCDRRDAAWAWSAWAARLAWEENASDALCAASVEAAIIARAEDRHALAARLLSFAARKARRDGLGEYEGDALCELAVLRHELGHTDEALRHFGAAVRAYGDGNRHLLTLGYRMGLCWLAEGHFQAALRLLLAVGERIRGPLAPAVFGAVARASAAVGWKWNYEAAWNATWEQLRDADSRGQADALLQLVRAAVIRRDWIRAETAMTPAAHLLLTPSCADLNHDAEKMAGVLRLTRRARTREAVEEAFPDLAHLRLGRGERWNPQDASEPWQPSYAIRAVADAFWHAVQAGPPRDPLGWGSRESVAARVSRR